MTLAPRNDEAELWASVASTWEVAIKHRLGKLPLPCPLADWPQALTSLEVSILPVCTAHVIHPVGIGREVKDPFDRLLIAICASEQMQLLTRDRTLVAHPLALRPAAA
jgi:PIN domain nuclease of toxin-antitoxin system